MASSQTPYQRLIVPGAIVVLLISSLAPSRFHKYGPYVRNASAVALAPITYPIRQMSTQLTPDPPLPGRGTRDDMRARVIEQEGQLIRLEEENLELRRQVAILQGLRREIGSEYRFARGAVLGSSTDASAPTVQVSVGTRDGVAPGMAVVDADQLALVGRVVQAGPTSCAVEPLTVDGTLLEVVITAPAFSREQLEKVVERRALLEYSSKEGFVGKDIDSKIPIGVNDLARLSDRSGRIAWPNVVQGMVIGQVTQVTGDEDQPLRQRIRVTPIRSLRRADEVIVVVPRRDDGEATP